MLLRVFWKDSQQPIAPVLFPAPGNFRLATYVVRPIFQSVNIILYAGRGPGETRMKSTDMLLRDLPAMEVGESIRACGIHVIIPPGACDKTTPLRPTCRSMILNRRGADWTPDDPRYTCGYAKLDMDHVQLWRIGVPTSPCWSAKIHVCNGGKPLMTGDATVHDLQHSSADNTRWTDTRWIGVDWGTSNMRAYVMDEADRVIAALHSDRGMGQLAPDEFEPALLQLVSGYLPAGRVTPVFACGMVGSRQGWAEANYEAVPCEPPTRSETVSAPCRDPRIAVRIIPGIKQEKPADVMRGEETQIAGFLSARPDFDGVLCLPGTHTKWARISAKEVVSFQTFMTGEIFSLLAGQSVLRHSVAAQGWDDDAFATALSDALSKPESVAARLFTIRADALLSDSSGVSARARVSGLLIGMELAAARPYWLGQEVAIIGTETLAEAYRMALAQQGLSPQVMDAEAMTLAGLKSAYHETKETKK